MILSVSNLRVQYGPVIAVHDVSFSLDAGECVAVLGANGAGKTSCIEAIAGLLPKSGGDVVLDGANISSKPASAIARMGLALVPQWRELFSGFSVAETLLAARTAAKYRPPIPENYIYDLFPTLKERSQSRAGNLSGGEQQMLAIARALVTRPKVLILDEPSAGLAARVVDVLIGVVNRIRSEGVSLLISEQNIDLASAVAERCVVLSVGKLTWTGPITQAAHDEEIRRAYFA